MNIPITVAKAQLPELVRRAEAGEEIILTRHGAAAVRFVPVRTAAHRAARNKRLLELSAEMARLKTPGPDAAHASDFMFDDEGLPV